MFVLNDDLSIYATRGDIVFFTVSAEQNGKTYTFKAGDLIRFKVYGKKNAKNVVLQRLDQCALIHIVFHHIYAANHSIIEKKIFQQKNKLQTKNTPLYKKECVLI